MAADFSIGKVFVAGYHDTKDCDVQFCPFEFESLSEGCHKEQEEDRCHVVPLTYSNTLRDLFDFVFNLQHACVVAVDHLNGSCKFWRGSVLTQDVNEQLVVSLTRSTKPTYEARS